MQRTSERGKGGVLAAFRIETPVKRRRGLSSDVAASSLGASLGIVVGHPLDLVKTTLQERPDARMSLVMLRRLAAQRGSLWRGVGPPLAGNVMYTATTFSLHQRLCDVLAPVIGVSFGGLALHSCAGTLAGMASTVLTTPLELVKVKLCLDPAAHGGTPGATTRELLRVARQGGPRALYSGWSAMLIRDGPGSGVYLGTYNALKAPNSRVGELLAGGVAGVLCWLSVLPVDVAKTRIQVRACSHADPTAASMPLWPTILSIYRNEGTAALFRGALPLSVRAFMVNAVTFWSYEECLRLLS